MSTFTNASDLADLNPRKRSRYSAGMIVGADELSQDQRYLTNRDERHQRALHGWGVVSGLNVLFGDDNELQVQPGTALDAVGRLICVDMTQCADILAWVNTQEEVTLDSGNLDVWVALCWAECETDLLPVASGPCRSLDDSLAPSRVADSFALQLSLMEPAVRGELPEIEGSGGGASNVLARLTRDGASITAKRNALDSFVRGRGDPEGFANRCLDPVDDGCVPLARVRLRLEEADGGFVFAGPQEDAQITTNTRPVVTSTAFLQEWLLQLTPGSSGGPVVTADPQSLEQLTNVDADGAVRNSVVVRSNRGVGSARAWEDALLELDLLADVDVAGVSGTDVVLGWDTARELWRPRALPELVPPEVDVGPFVLSRPAPLGIVAAGTVFLPASPSALRWRVDRAYGGLEVVGSERSVALLRFTGYEELFASDGASLVVKLTPEGSRASTAQVLQLSEAGILIGLAELARDTEVNPETRWFEHLDVLGIELKGEPPRLHVEISAFGDDALLKQLQED